MNRREFPNVGETLFSDVLRAKERTQNYTFLDTEQAVSYARQTTERKITFLAERTLAAFEEIDGNANINLALTAMGADINSIL